MISIITKNGHGLGVYEALLVATAGITVGSQVPVTVLM